MRDNKLFYALLLVIIIISSCEPIEERDKYRRPDWLAGKLYDQILDQGDLTSFARALVLTGYDTIINVSGSYTVFAPTDDAFEKYFQDNQGMGDSVGGMNYSDLLKMVQFHIIQNPWNIKQLQSLNPNGWVTDDNHPINSKPWSYKRQTLLQNNNLKLYYQEDRGEYAIVDSTIGTGYRMVYNEKRKFAPLFFDDFFGLNFLKFDDYSFYYKRNFESGSIYFGDARLGEEVFAENGFVYPVDKVVDPAKNAHQFIIDESSENSYREFLKLIYRYPDFRYNRDATFNQASAQAGEQFDSLYNLSFNGLLFNIMDEEYLGNYGQSTQRHFGFFPPTDGALQKLLDEVVLASSGYPHWSSMEVVPDEIIRIIINAHMSEYPVYPTNFNEGFFNGVGDIITLDENEIVDKNHLSNCTFIGMNEAVIPRAFTSVAGPVYLRPGYSYFMYAMEHSRVLPAVKRAGADYSFFIIPDFRMDIDSSLLVVWNPVNPNAYSLRSFDRAEDKLINMSRQEMSKRILNQIGITRPTGFANKEFIENLAGNYITFDHLNNNVSGSAPNTFGYLGDSMVVSDPIQLDEPTDNGVTYEVGAWFNFSKNDLFSIVSSYPRFYSLLVKAGLIDPKNYVFTFISAGDYYTVFAPTDAAINATGLDTLAKADLNQALRYHFVKDHLIFTDGRKPAADYETSRIDEASDEFTTVFSELKVVPGFDQIEIYSQEGGLYTTVVEQEGKTNRQSVTITGTGNNPPYWEFITTGVVHEVDTVFTR
jgi:uncharacterized surface protein with fasciclin (FAS1) repeats